MAACTAAGMPQRVSITTIASDEAASVHPDPASKAGHASRHAPPTHTSSCPAKRPQSGAGAPGRLMRRGQVPARPLASACAAGGEPGSGACEERAQDECDSFRALLGVAPLTLGSSQQPDSRGPRHAACPPLCTELGSLLAAQRNASLPSSFCSASSAFSVEIYQAVRHRSKCGCKAQGRPLPSS